MRQVALASSSMLLLLACVRSHDTSSGGGEPCRWRFGDAVEIGRAAYVEGLVGAVHATDDVALVIASDGVGHLGALVTTAERPERLATFYPSLAPARSTSRFVHSTESGFALSTYPGCTMQLLDGDLAPSGTVDLGGEALDPRCDLSQTVAGRVEVAVAEGLGGRATIHSVRGLGTPEQTVEDLGAVATPGGAALRVVHQPEHGTWVWVSAGTAFAMERLDGAGRAAAEWPAPGGLSSSTADHRRGGIVVLPRRDPPSGVWGTWQLEWFGPDGDLASPVVTPLPDVWPSEEPVGAEDGVFIPLHGGTLAFVRWGEHGMQILRHEDGDRVLQSRAIVRPGRDRGGLLYSLDEGGTIAVRWRSLVCDR